MSSPAPVRLFSAPTAPWLTRGLLLVFALASIPYAAKALQNRSAFQRWLPQISELDNGVDIAQHYNYPNPPIMALLLYPLVKLPLALQGAGLPVRLSQAAAALAWFWIKALLTLFSVRWAVVLAQTPGRPFPRWAQVLAVLMSLRPILGDLQHGNVNLFILFLVMAALMAFRRRRDLLAGGLLGLAIACKVTPALFLPYLVWKRAWRALAGSVVGLALFLWPGSVPALLLGWDNSQQQLDSWFQNMVHPYLVEGKVLSEHNNQSLPGLLMRLTTHSPSFSIYRDGQYVPTHYDNLLTLPPWAVGWAVKGCMALFALLGIWLCRTPLRPRSSGKLAVEYSIVLIGMLLFSERTWTHHCVTLLLPFAVLCYHLAAADSSRKLRLGLAAFLAGAVLFMAATSTIVRDERHVTAERLPRLFAKRAHVYGAYVAAELLLLAGLVGVSVGSLRKQRERGHERGQGDEAVVAALQGQ
jgi:alpha-1,2-mannosyltransferase